MNTNSINSESANLTELARSYEAQGFTVKVLPAPSDIPFDLSGYRADLLAEKEGQHLLIEVRRPGTPLSVDRLQSLAETVRQQPGWQLLLVPASEGPGQSLRTASPLVSWPATTERARRAGALLASGETEAAFLMLWVTLEALLRRHAEQIALPVDRQPTSALLNYFYSQGELTFEQFQLALQAQQVRNQLVHGFEATEVPTVTQSLHELVSELLSEWAYTQNAA
jgi:hypothetical protein